MNTRTATRPRQARPEPSTALVKFTPLACMPRYRPFLDVFAGSFAEWVRDVDWHGWYDDLDPWEKEGRDRAVRQEEAIKPSLDDDYRSARQRAWQRLDDFLAMKARQRRPPLSLTPGADVIPLYPGQGHVRLLDPPAEPRPVTDAASPVIAPTPATGEGGYDWDAHFRRFPPEPEPEHEERQDDEALDKHEPEDAA